MAPLTSLVVKPTARHTASIIFSHGLGDSGAGWQPVAEMLSSSLPHVKWILPNAPIKKVTINMGMSMPAWYDIKDLGPRMGDMAEDEEGMLESVSGIRELVKKEVEAGIPENRIIIGGFSQGSVVSVLTALSHPKPLAGLVIMSGYLPLHKTIFGENSIHANAANKAPNGLNKKGIPIFLAHGKVDQVIPFKYGQASAEAYKTLGGYEDLTVKFYDNMGHEASNDELRDLLQFLNRVLPQKEA